MPRARGEREASAQFNGHSEMSTFCSRSVLFGNCHKKAWRPECVWVLLETMTAIKPKSKGTCATVQLNGNIFLHVYFGLHI